VTIPNLEKANGLVGSAVLHVGQTLKVPEKMVAQAAGEVADQATQVTGAVQQFPGSIAAAAAAATSAVGSTPPADTAGLAEYTVVKGDSPYKIAKKFKITPDELMKVNGITDPKKIQIGQKLKIPASSKKTAQPATQ
jgi:LysM repeat protein